MEKSSQNGRGRSEKILEKTANVLWKPLPFISESLVIPVLVAVPVVVFALFVWLIAGLSSVE